MRIENYVIAKALKMKIFCKMNKKTEIKYR